MGQITTIGLDLAKTVFQIHGVDADGKVVVRRAFVDWSGSEHYYEDVDQNGMRVCTYLEYFLHFALR